MAARDEGTSHFHYNAALMQFMDSPFFFAVVLSLDWGTNYCSMSSTIFYNIPARETEAFS